MLFSGVYEFRLDSADDIGNIFWNTLVAIDKIQREIIYLSLKFTKFPMPSVDVCIAERVIITQLDDLKPITLTELLTLNTHKFAVIFY